MSVDNVRYARWPSDVICDYHKKTDSDKLREYSDRCFAWKGTLYVNAGRCVAGALHPGFGGREYEITLFSGEKVKTNNLWDDGPTGHADTVERIEAKP